MWEGEEEGERGRGEERRRVFGCLEPAQSAYDPTGVWSAYNSPQLDSESRETRQLTWSTRRKGDREGAPRGFGRRRVGAVRVV